MKKEEHKKTQKFTISFAELFKRTYSNIYNK